MLEKTDNDLPKANDENVSEEASIPNAKKEDETTEKSTQPAVEAVTEEQAEKVAPAPEKKQEETVEAAEEPVEAVQDASETVEEAETEEKDATTEAKRSEQVFDGMEPKKMLEYFTEALGNKPVQSLKSTVDALTKAFEKEMASLKDTQRQAFIAEGGNPDAFYFNLPVLKEFNNLIRRYKSHIGTYYKNVEEKQQKSLEQRLALIEELKELIGVDQDINKTYKKFKDLQRRWKETGQVPRMEANNIWKTYHHHVGHFYDFLHLNRELRELDFKFNLEQKLKICEQAEALASMEDISKAFRHLQTLHKKWKDELGPVDKEHSEKVWQRFSDATKIVHDKRRYFIKNQEEIFEENLLKKRAILSQIEDLLTKEFNSKTNINNFSKTYDGLRESFFSIGKVPEKYRNDLWSTFKKTSNQFSKKRNRFYKSLKKEYATNVTKRKELIAQAEILKEQTNHKETTLKIIALQKEWKVSGPVRKEDFIKLNTQFRALCNEYFENKDANRDQQNEKQKENLNKKMILFSSLKDMIASADKPNEKEIDNMVSEWNAIGYVPRSKMSINQDFLSLVDNAYKIIGISSSEITQKSYQNKLDNMKEDDDSIRKELQSLNRRIGEIKQEIIQLETNLQFFGKNQDKNPIVIKVHEDIAKHQKRLEGLEEKKRLAKSLHKH
jgi:predicted  nucleic acid-binding Zn-ribbon protein